MPFAAMILGWIGGPLWSAVKGVLTNPYVVGALALAAAFLLWRIEESRIAAANIRTDRVAASCRAAFDQEQASFRAVDSALKRQNAAVAAWGAQGRQETARATTAWGADAKALKASQRAASSRPAPDPHGDPAAEADTIFRASRGELP